MPISIKRDVKPSYGLGSRFSLKDTPLYIPLGGGDIIYFREVLGSYVNAVRPRIADENWYDFHSNGNFSFPNFEHDVARSLSLKFDLDLSRVSAFDELGRSRGTRGNTRNRKRTTARSRPTSNRRTRSRRGSRLEYGHRNARFRESTR